jgi:hypothetical protein
MIRNLAGRRLQRDAILLKLPYLSQFQFDRLDLHVDRLVVISVIDDRFQVE